MKKTYHAYGSEYHVQGHGYVEVERVVVGHADDKVHDDERGPGAEGHLGAHPAAFGGEDEALDRDEEERGEGDQVAAARVDPVKRSICLK